MEYYAQKWDDLETNLLPSLEIWYAAVFGLAMVFTMLSCMFYLMCKPMKKINETSLPTERENSIKTKIKKKVNV
jgi:Na+-transporting methylmalonyl-CoA/oxaloacetate decarboxylase gamma subunit